jgi:hypothetical protein
MNERPQTYKNHARYVPAFHFVLLPLLILNFIWTVIAVKGHPSSEGYRTVLVAVALLLLAFMARIFALRVQDRVIRLEMRLRLRELLPPDIASRAQALGPRQLVALRFASDDELPVLARKVLDDNLTDQKAIKRLIKNWQADHLRA